MAQIPGYEYDIFISYTHDDNEGFGSRSGMGGQLRRLA